MIAEPIDVHQQLRQLAARISVIAEGPGVSYIPTGRHMHDSKEPTTGAGASLSEQFAARLRSAEGSPRRLAALAEWCEREIRARTHTPPKPDRKFKDVILEDHAGQHYLAVGAVTSTPPMTVYRWRREAGLDGPYGREKEDR